MPFLGEEVIMALKLHLFARLKQIRWLAWGTLLGLWRIVCLVLLLAIAASVPIFQFASLGYLLEFAGRWARGGRLRDNLPGLKIAGRIGTVTLFIAISVIPVAVLRNLSASVHLIAPDSSKDIAWRIGVAIVSLIWLVYVWWALLRGGRVWHFLWPAPLLFFRQAFCWQTWNQAADRLLLLIASLRLAYLWRLGFVGAVGTAMYLIVPAGLMIVGLRAAQPGVRGLGTLLGVVLMLLVLQYLPFLQIQFAKRPKLSSFWRIGKVRRDFRRAPWLHAVAMLGLVVFSLPLYLLRIEQPPQQLIWLLCVAFVLFSLPAKFLLAWAVRFADARVRDRMWFSRYLAWVAMFAVLPLYTLFLYLASLSSWDGSAIILFQHALLVPVPFLP